MTGSYRLGYPVAAILAAILWWAYALTIVDLDRMGSLGLVSALPAVWYVAPAILTVSLVAAVYGRAGRPVLWAHIAAFVLAVHATPVILYGTVRYAWAWKHIGVVDYLQRGNELWTDAPYLAVYHNWPGFFAGAASVTDAAGLASAAPLAAWAPVFFELLTAVALVVLFRALTDDRRLVWLGTWLFLLGNWVGQDYFAPQAFAFVLYLLILGVVLRFFRTGATSARHPHARAGLLAAVVLMCGAVATSHPLTPALLTVALTALVVFRIATPWWLPLVPAITTITWWVTGARDFVRARLGAAIQEIGLVTTNAQTNVDSYHFETGQQLVSAAGRAAVLLIAALAIAGAIRRWVAHRWDRTPAILAVAPVLMVAGGSYDGEMIFRVYLFALPFLAFLAADLLCPAPSWRPRWRTPAMAVAISAMLFAGFTLAYFGKDSWYRFTADEVRAAEFVYRSAPPGSLLVEGSRTYPSRLANYERFTYVSIADEPADSVEELLRDPVGKLSEWLADARYTGAYVIITRSQRVENDTIGPLPKGALAGVEQALKASDRFDVLVGSDDATVFTLATEAR
jgi:hypothetical protein